MLSKALIQKVSSLAYKKFREELRLFVAEGDKLVEELLTSTLTIEHLFVTPSSVLARHKYQHIEVINEKDMKRMSSLKTPAQSLAVIKFPQYKPDKERLKKQLTIVLDEVQDPGNLGTIIRLADWFGINDIICSASTADCYNPKVVQATMGAIARVNIHYVRLAEFLAEFSSDTPVYGTFLNGTNIYESKLSSNGFLIMGNEGNGISEEVESLIRHRLYIPSFVQHGKGSESLNVAIAAAICCSEFKRRG